MTQKLILPIPDMRITASIDTKAYKHSFGFGHYGTDFVSASRTRTIYSSGEGRVVGMGEDRACGKILSVLYPAAYNSRNNKTEDILFRYFHLEAVVVKKGQKVAMGEALGEYGSTGSYAGTGKHLHLEADLDTINFLHTPTVTASNYLKGTNQGALGYYDKRNTVRNPMDYLHKKESLPNCQTFSSPNSDFIRAEDTELPVYTEEIWEKLELLREYNNLKAKLESIKSMLA